MKDQDSMRFPFLVNSVCAALLGLTMNLLLFFLITKRTPTIMKPYSRIMRIHCLSDVAYDTVCFITGLVRNCYSSLKYIFHLSIRLRLEAMFFAYGKALLLDYHCWSIICYSAAGIGSC